MPAAPRRLPQAVADIVSAAEWYDDQQPGLGDDFVDEVDAVIRSLSSNPLVHAIRFADVRCARLKRFKKYGVFYFVWQGEIIVFSVFHGGLHPRRLRERRRKIG